MVLLFYPPRRLGIIVQVGLSLLLMAGIGVALYQSSLVELGPELLLYLLMAVLMTLPLPLLAYRIYALWRAHYDLERNGLRLSWGLRAEDIPLTDIEWVRPVSDLIGRLPLPWLSWPGAVLGGRQVRGLGMVEFLSSDKAHLVLIGTFAKVYAISPADPQEFIRNFQSITELGSLAPIPSQSSYPSSLVTTVWINRVARGLLLSGLILDLALVAWVTLVIPTTAAISLGFTPAGLPAEAGPAARLMMLPVLNTINLIIDVTAGLFYYRKVENRPLAYLLWGGAVISPLLLLAAVYSILR